MSRKIKKPENYKEIEQRNKFLFKSYICGNFILLK